MFVCYSPDDHAAEEGLGGGRRNEVPDGTEDAEPGLLRPVQATD